MAPRQEWAASGQGELPSAARRLLPRSPMRLAVLVLICVTTTGCGYRAGSYSFPRAAFLGARVTQDCMDLALSRRAAADDEGGIIVQYEIGNRCDHPIEIDLQHVHVIGHVRSGREVKLFAFDPDSELAPLPLDGRSYASEAIAYRDPDSEEVVGACIDIGTLTHAGLHRWVCTAPETPHAAAGSGASPTGDAGSGSADEEVEHVCKPGVNDDYVGNRACTVYGAWAMPARLPPMFVDWGLRGRSVSIAAADLGTVHDQLAPAMTMDFRFGINVWRGVYTGFDTEIGGAWGASEELAQMNGTPAAPLYLGGSFLLGVRGALGRVSVGAELSLGGRFLQGTQHVQADGTSSLIVASETNLEARVHVEYWLGPWVSFGAELGTNMLNTSEQLAGGYFSFHTRAFGGDRAHK